MEQVPLGIIIIQHPLLHITILLALLSIHVPIPHGQPLKCFIRKDWNVIALWTVRRAGLGIVKTLNDVVLTTLETMISKPVLAASVEGLEEVQSLEVNVRGHPVWVVRSVEQLRPRERET